MTHLELRARIGPDGILNLNVPVGISEANREVKVIVEPAEAAAETARLTREQWARFVDDTAAPGWESLSVPSKASSKIGTGGLDLSLYRRYPQRRRIPPCAQIDREDWE